MNPRNFIQSLNEPSLQSFYDLAGAAYELDVSQESPGPILNQQEFLRVLVFEARARPEILADVKEGQSHAGEMTEGQSTGDLDKCSVSTVGVGERNVHKPQQKRT